MPTSRASAIIGAPVEGVWDLIRNFGSFASWVPGVESAELLSGTAETCGAVQRINFIDGTSREEKLIGIDDSTYSLSYKSIGKRPPPAFNLIGFIRLFSVTSNNSTFIERVVQFDCELGPEESAKLSISISNTLADSLNNLRKIFDE